MSMEFGTFSELVTEVRRQLGWSQEGLAHKLGVSFATINRWENGKTTPSKLARAQFDSLCKEMHAQGNLTFPGGKHMTKMAGLNGDGGQDGQ